MENTLLNMIPSSYIPVVHLSQYDIGRNIQFKLMDGNSEYSVPSGANIKILATKPSGLGFEVACTFSGNIVTLVNTETMSNEAGRFKAELRITSGNVILGTSNFIMNVERSPHPEGTIDGDAETLLPELTLLVERIENSNARIESMTASATPLPSGQNPTATYNPTTNSLDLGIPVADRQYITVDGVNYPITSITKTVVDEVSGLLVAYGTDSTVFIPDGVGVKNVAQFLQTQINGKVSAVKLNGDILTPHYDSAFGDGVVDLGTISDDTKADAIVKSASGSIASFSDGGDDLPMKSLKVNIVPKQSGSGDPSPSNVRPISGWDAVDVYQGGGNLFDRANQTILRDASNNGWWINVSGSCLEKGGVSNATFGIPCKPNKSYKVTVDYSSTIFRVCYGKMADLSFASGNVTQNVYNCQTDSTTGYREINFNTGDGATYLFIQVAYGMEDVAKNTINVIEVANTYPISLSQTVYGGVPDIVSGKLVIDKIKLIIDGTVVKPWVGSNYGNVYRFGIEYPSGLIAKYKGAETFGISDKLKPSYDATIGANASTPAGFYVFPYSNQLFVSMPSADFDTTAKAIEWFKENKPEIVYELATPTEIQLTPTEVKSLLGSNNIWSESGTVEVEYRADTTLAYNELLSLIASLS